MSRKNVIVLHTDQQRYDSLGCTGNEAFWPLCGLDSGPRFRKLCSLYD